jgi:uncharacterized protein
MAQPSVHGRFIWQELLTEDTNAAAAFYSKVIGWHVQPSQEPGIHNYSVFATDQGVVGGLTSLPDHAREAGARPHWLPYIGAENVDATAAKAERLGGRVLRAATDVGELGRYAVLADPQGSTFGIYRPRNPSGSVARSQPQRGEFAWQELASSDFEAAFRFYGDLFGWQALRRMDMGPAGTYLIFGRDGVQQGGMYKLSSQMPSPYWLSYIEVPGTEAAVDTARGAGGRVTVEPMDVPGGGRIAQLLDPAGVLFAVHTAGRAAAGSGAGQPDAGKIEARKPAAAKPAPRPAAKPTPKPAAESAAEPAAKPTAKPVARGAARPAPAPAEAGKKQAPVARGAKKVAKKKAGKRAAKRPAAGSKARSKGKGVRRAAGKGARRVGAGRVRLARAKAGAKSARTARAGRGGARRGAAKRAGSGARGARARGARGRGRAARGR